MTFIRATVAAPIFRNIAEDAIKALNIEKQENGIDKEYRYFDTLYETVPDVVGLDVKEARKLLKGFDIEYSGTGNTVVSMSPEAGSSVVAGSGIRLMLDNE